MSRPRTQLFIDIFSDIVDQCKDMSNAELHVILAGIGGIYVEVYKDVSFRVCPIAEKDAEAMLDDLQGAAILAGARGKKLNRKALVDALVKLSKLPEKQPKIAELDINPFILNAKDGSIVDARVILE